MITPCTYCGAAYHAPFDDGLVECRNRLFAALSDVTVERDEARDVARDEYQQRLALAASLGETAANLLDDLAAARAECERLREHLEYTLRIIDHELPPLPDPQGDAGEEQSQWFRANGLRAARAALVGGKL